MDRNLQKGRRLASSPPLGTAQRVPPQKGRRFASSPPLGTAQRVPPLAVFFAFVSLFTLALPQNLLAAADHKTITEQAGKYFASDVVARADQGWRLLWIKIGGSGDELRIELTMGLNKQAEMFVLSFSDDSGNVSWYRRAVTAVPKEKRQYVIENDIIATLRDGPITTIEFGCVYPFIESTNRAVAVDPDAYYRVVARHSGKKAQRRLASEIARSLKSGNFGGGDKVDKQTVAFTMVGQRTTEVLTRLDRLGRVQGVEVRSYPLPHTWRTYTANAALTGALRASKFVTGVTMSDDEITLELTGGKQVVLADDDFNLNEEAACGC